MSLVVRAALAQPTTSTAPVASVLQDAPPPSANPSTSMPTATQTTPAAPDQSAGENSATQRVVDRSGPILLGGFARGNNVTVPRIDAIVPLPISSAPRLRVGVLGEYHHEVGTIDTGVEAEAYTLIVGPNAYYDWKLPIVSSAGDFVVSAEGGVAAGLVWFKVDQPFMPGRFERLTAWEIRLASSLQFRARGGLVISLQPLGFYVPLNSPQLSRSTMIMLRYDAYWEGALLCGYQF